jgi:hypothetical protein
MAEALIAFTADTSAVSELNGFLISATQGIKTDRHMDSVLEYTFSEMSSDFYDNVDQLARAEPERFHHIYEWNRVGDPTARLWRNLFMGPRGHKVATFRWMASKSIVPVPPNSEIQRADGKPHKNTLKEVHQFIWKAPIMEYDMSVLIKPSRNGVLAMLEREDGGYTLYFTRQSVQVDHPGGRLTTGALTKEFTSWWGGAGAEGTFEKTVRKTIEGQLGLMEKEVGRIGARSRSKTFKMSTMSNEAAFAEGKAEAEAWLGSVINRYRALANARRAFMDRGADF